MTNTILLVSAFYICLGFSAAIVRSTLVRITAAILPSYIAADIDHSTGNHSTFLFQGKAGKINPAFNSILAELRQKCRLPILLPTDLGNEGEEAPIYARVVEAKPDRYELILGFYEDCEGGNACRWGTVSGEKVRRKVRPVANSAIEKGPLN